MHISLALDTCVLSDVSFVVEMSKMPGVDLVIPSVVYMERRRQLLNHRKDPAGLDKLLERARIKVSNFDKKTAQTASELMHSQIKVCPRCNKLDWMDVMILSSIDRPYSTLVTKNVKDFQQYGYGDRVITPDEARSRCLAWS